MQNDLERITIPRPRSRLLTAPVPRAVHRNNKNARKASMENSARLQSIAMKEEFAESEEFVLEERTNDQGSIVFKMVHIVAIGLPVLVVWLAQPGSSKLYLENCQL